MGPTGEPPHETVSPAASPGPTGAVEPGIIVAERYRVIDLIGEGAMGAVYRVEHIHMRKTFALKVLHPSMSIRPEVVARFEREAIAAGKIAHRNVAASTDFGRMPDSSFFLILEYVAGRSLRAELGGGRLEPRRVIKIMQGIVAGVAAAHAQGVIHRDLKPDNVMLVERDGDPDFVKVLDFGIAKLEPFSGSGNVAQPLTQAGTVIGTPDYMSPEQALGRGIDVRSDLYSLGVVLYELLTGDAPFRGGPATLLRQQVQDPPPPLPPEVIHDGHPVLIDIVSKLLAKSPDERYQTAKELMAALDAAASTLATKVVLHDLGLQGHDTAKTGRVLPLVFQRLPRAFVARLTGRRVAFVAGMIFATSIAVFIAVFRDISAGERAGRGAAPNASASTNANVAAPVSAVGATTGTSTTSASVPTTSASTSPSASGKASSRSAPKSTAPRRTGPGGIYIPPPREWFK